MKKLFSYIVGLFRQVNNETHVLLNDEVRHALEKYSIKGEVLESLLEKHLVALELEKSALDIIMVSTFTQEIRDQDKLRDRIFRGFMYAIRSALFHYDTNKIKQAQIINTVLRHYGNVAKKTLDAESAAIDNVIRDLRSNKKNYAAIIELGLEEWLVQLQLANEAFQNLMRDRYDEKTHLPIIRMKEARKETDSLIHLIFSQLEILIFTEGQQKYEPFITEINLIMERFKNILAQQAGNRKQNNENSENENNNENNTDNEIINDNENDNI
ncbi:MAG: DUF6261 family protein [Bacteroidales bacterium]|nr:DUF6261 family protein [Bacteroidales bacterium]